MKGCAIFILMIICLLVPVGVSRACGRKHKPVQKEVQHTQSHRQTCCARGEHKESDGCKKCTHNCGESACNCFHASGIVALKQHSSDLVLNPVIVICQPVSWFFREAIPQSVYLSLWMPPNISC